MSIKISLAKVAVGLARGSLILAAFLIPMPLSQASEHIDISPEIIDNSPVLQRWLRSLPNVWHEIKNDPSFKTRVRLGYSHFPSSDGKGGWNVGVEDIFIKRSHFTVSGDYQATFNGKLSAYGADLRYYLFPLGNYINLAPVLGYRYLKTNSYNKEGINVGVRLMLALSRSGAADISLTQTWVKPGSGEDVGITTLSAAYALARHWRISTEIQKQNARESKDSRVGIIWEWIP